MTGSITPKEALPLSVRIAELCGSVPHPYKKQEYEKWKLHVSITADWIVGDLCQSIMFSSRDIAGTDHEWFEEKKAEFKELLKTHTDGSVKRLYGVLLGIVKPPNNPRSQIAVQTPWGEQTLPHEEAVQKWEAHRFEEGAFDRDTGILRERYGIHRCFVPDISRESGMHVMKSAHKLVGKAVNAYSNLEPFDKKVRLPNGDIKIETRKSRVVLLLEDMDVPPESIVSYGDIREAAHSRSFAPEAAARPSRAPRRRRAVSERRRSSRSPYEKLLDFARKENYPVEDIDGFIKDDGYDKHTLTEEQAQAIIDTL